MIPYSRLSDFYTLSQTELAETVTFAPAHTHIALVWEFSPPPPPGTPLQSNNKLILSAVVTHSQNALCAFSRPRLSGEGMLDEQELVNS